MRVCPVCQREYAEGAVSCTEDGVPLVAMGREVHTRAEELVGQIVEGRWRIERIIGKGGMGTVYACRHAVVGKVAAIKVLRAGADRSEAVLQRFVREAQTANLVKSRHIVEVSDFGQLPSGAFFVVMELLEGHDLGHAMRRGMARRDLVHVFGQVAETLQLAHEKGIVHRDLKPDNVFLVNEAGDPLFVKLLDFGIAKILHGDGTAGLTETGVILGTPYYMSPEQARAESVDHRTDVYALGVMMYRAFTGRLPFMADSTMGVLTRHITEAPQPPSEIGNVDTPTERMILRCLAKKPEYRFQSMRELADALRQVPVEGQPASSMVAATGPAQAPTRSDFAPSGAHAAPTPGGSYAYGAQPSGPYTPAPGHGSQPHAAMAASAPSFTPSAHPSFAPSGAMAPAPTHVGGLHASGAYAPVPAQPAAPEPTTRGVASTSAPEAQRGSSTLVLAVGALSMAAIGAVVALFVFARPGAVSVGSPAGVPQPAVSSGNPAGVPQTPPVPTAATAAAASAVAAPTTAAPAATAAPSASAAAPQPARPRGPMPRAPAPTATATAAPGPRLPQDVRSPFE